VLDAGSGIGEVALLLGSRVGPDGAIVGVDLSAELVERAQARAEGVGNVEYQVGDITSLPFTDASFDAVYSERVFLHLSSPQAAMTELFQVLRPGGRLLIVDLDNTRVACDADDGELADLLASRLAGVVANARSGRSLRSQAILAGFTDVDSEAFARTVTDREIARGMAIRPVEDRVAELVAEGAITGERADAFLADQDRRAAEGRFQISTLWYLVAARKPNRPRPGGDL
jgi:SAM-dependent methyltransferase